MAKWLDEHFEETLLVVLLVFISCVEFAQVIVRNIPGIPALKWAEEFCRFCWIWSVFISLPYTIRKGNMLRVSVVLDLFPAGLRKALNIAVDLVCALVMVVLGIHSVSVVQGILKSGETSPAMLWPMWIVYSVMLFGFFMGFLRALQQAFLHGKSIREAALSTTEQTMADARAEAEAGLRAQGQNREGGAD